VHGMAFRAIAVRWNVRLEVLVHDPLVARCTVAPMAPVGGIGTVRFVAQPTGIDVAVYYRGGNRLGLRRSKRLPRLQRLPTVASWASGRARITGAPLLDELMTRQACHLRHAVFVDLHLVVTCAA
jgi:hypothetical protein